MNKITLSSVAVSIMTLPVMALAAIDANTPPSSDAFLDLPALIVKIETIMWMVFGAMAVIMFVVADVLFSTPKGQPEKVQAARSAFIWGIAGVVVGIIAYSILAIIGNTLGV